MTDARAETPGQRLRAALDLFDLSLRMFRQRLRRERPEISEAAIDAEVARWLEERPGAEHGDAPGIRVTWPRP